MAKDRPRIGRQLRRAMEQARLNQNQVADALGVSRGSVNAWLNDRAYPQNSIGALEELLGVSLDDEPVPEPEEETARLRREVAQLRAESDAWREMALRARKGNGDDITEARAI